MDYTTLLLTRTGAIATITLNRPEVLHALNATMFDELEHAFTALAADPTLRVILLTGSGDRAFAAGADIRALAQTDAVTGEQTSLRGQQVFALIESCGKPVIAAINGVALGGGCELALACTLRIASDKARLGLPELKLGLIPGYGGTQRLTRLVGPGNALRAILTAEFLPAAEALRIGLVNEVTTPENLMPRANELAAIIASMAPLAVTAALSAVAAAPSAYSHEAALFGKLCATADKAEGIEAFLTKRPATFTGQ